MPRLTEPMCKAHKFNQYLPQTLKYKILLPPVLKNSVSTKKEKSKGAVCVQEMTLLMACMKKEDYKPGTCGPQILSFNKCVEESTAELVKMKEAQKKGLQVEGSRKFPAQQINKVLRRFPQKEAVFELSKKQRPDQKKI